MRIVALSLVTLLIAAAVPADADPMSAKDECENRVYLPSERTQMCLRIDLASAPAQAREPVGDRMFLMTADEPGDAKTQAGTTTVLGTLYGDSNGLDGLQRSSITVVGKYRPADDALLI